ncbi:MAG: competence/damage-inducible protein A, partial [Planctomycetota bacterium]|nr:competence/damage-inducible protein A [Planctomycetota bacterium]
MSTPTQTQTRVSLLSIGDELLLGQITDTNMPYIAQRLLPLGFMVAGSETTGDELDDIVAAFQRALARADIVIATGGLGPTEDDLTMEALAKALGVELEFRQEVMDQMAARFKRPLNSFTAANRKQAFLPKGANILRNDWGTAPGVHAVVSPPCPRPQGDGDERARKHVFLMPGVPREMKGILGERILPFLAANFPASQAVAIRELHAWGIPESVAGDRIKPL